LSAVVILMSPQGPVPVALMSNKNVIKYAGHKTPSTTYGEISKGYFRQLTGRKVLSAQFFRENVQINFQVP